MTETVRVQVPVAPLVAEPRAATSMTSQYLNGYRLEVLEQQGDWLRVRGPDAYVGWIHRGYVRSDSRRAVADRVSLGCVARSAAGRVRALPLCALLDGDEELLSGEVASRGELTTRFPANAGAIVASALRYFEGASYLWGGVTPWGADCSGFVQTIYGLHGVPMPRDAADQARCGVEVSVAPESLEVADLAFFAEHPEGRITHVAIALGGARLVHLGLGRGGYALEELLGGDTYTVALRGRMRTARRMVS